MTKGGYLKIPPRLENLAKYPPRIVAEDHPSGLAKRGRLFGKFFEKKAQFSGKFGHFFRKFGHFVRHFS